MSAGACCKEQKVNNMCSISPCRGIPAWKDRAFTRPSEEGGCIKVVPGALRSTSQANLNQDNPGATLFWAGF